MSLCKFSALIFQMNNEIIDRLEIKLFLLLRHSFFFASVTGKLKILSCFKHMRVNVMPTFFLRILVLGEQFQNNLAFYYYTTHRQNCTVLVMNS